MKIHYCDQCGLRVPDEDLESGKAVVEAGDTAFCAECVVALEKNKPQSKRPPTRGNVLPGRVMRASGAAPRPKTNAFSTHGSESAHVKNPSPAHLRSAAPAKPNYLPHLLLGALAVVILFSVIFLFGGSKPKEPVTKAPPANPIPTTPASNPPPTVPVQKVAPGTGGLFGEMAQEHSREMDPAARKAFAAGKLNEAKEFRKNNPQDPWKYLELLRAVPEHTPAGDEAAKEIIALPMPADRSGTSSWYREWEVSNDNKDKPMAGFMPEYEGRKNLLRTTPPAGVSDVTFSRKFNVSASATVLECAVRGGPIANGNFVIEVDGKIQVTERLKGNAWQRIAVDLKSLSGKTVTVAARHVSGHGGENAYWSEPRFVVSPESGAVLTAFKSGAVNTSKLSSAVAARAAKRPFVGATEWVQPARFRTAINILAVADVKAGAIDSEWATRNNGGIETTTVKPQIAARVEIDFACPTEYDIKAVFERKVGNGDAAFVLLHPASGKQFLFTIGASGNKFAAIMEFAGKRFVDNPAAVNLGQCMENNRKYTIAIEVRKTRITGYLDGNLVTEWTPDMGAFQVGETWKLKDPTHIGVGTWNSQVIFHSVELSEAK